MPASLTRTTLAAAISAGSDTQILLLSGTGVAVGYGLFVDREFMVVTDISRTPFIGVMRGQSGTHATPHVKGASCFIAPKHYFTTYDRFGAGTYANENAQPYINIRNGKVWMVVGGVWIEGNTYGSYTGYGLSPAIWGDCPLAGMLVDPSLGSFDGDDFMSSFPTTAHGYVISGANGTVAHVAAVPHGEVMLSASAADNDECYFSSGNNTHGCIKADAVSTWWFETRIKINQITTSQGVFVGLHEETGNAATNITDTTQALAVLDYLGFQIIAATDIAAIWQSVHALNGGAHVVVSATAGTATVAFTKLGMKCVAGTVTFYIDGVPLATTVLSSATNFPLNQVMQAAWFTKAGTVSVTQTLTIDWWKAAQTRLAN